jgi:hypothetical protein
MIFISPKGEMHEHPPSKKLDNRSPTLQKHPAFSPSIEGGIRDIFGSICPYCTSKLYSETKRQFKSRVGCATDIVLHGFKCTNCNWWYIDHDEKDDNDEDYCVRYDNWLIEGVIYSFDYEFWRKPLELVGQEHARCLMRTTGG